MIPPELVKVLLPIVLKEVEKHLTKRERDPEYKAKAQAAVEAIENAKTPEEEFDALEKLARLQSQS